MQATKILIDDSEMEKFLSSALKKVEVSRKPRKLSCQSKKQSFLQERKMQKISEYKMRQDVYNNNLSSIASVFKRLLSYGSVDEGTPLWTITSFVCTFLL